MYVYMNLPSHIRWYKDYNEETPFRKYDSVTISEKKKEKTWCERNKYTALKRDTFFHHLEEEERGVTKCVSKGYECYRFTQEPVQGWLNKNVEHIDEDYSDFFKD
jgi:hypothetical protein